MKKIICIMAMVFGLAFCLSAQNEPKEDLDSQYAVNLLRKGETAPDFSIPAPDGKIVRLSDYRGKYVVIDFWASWCRDCRADIPTIKAAAEKFGKKGVVFIGISFDEDKEAWTQTIEKYGLDYVHASELKKWKTTDVSPKYKLDWIPTMYVIDPKGKVVLATVESEKMVKTLESLVK